VTMNGFASAVQDVDVRSVVPVSANISLKVGGGSSTVTVEAGGDLIEDDLTFHTDVDRDEFGTSRSGLVRELLGPAQKIPWVKGQPFCEVHHSFEGENYFGGSYSPLQHKRRC
jgi:hypothetical protein